MVRGLPRQGGGCVNVTVQRRDFEKVMDLGEENAAISGKLFVELPG